jgi:hypothetical protein
MTMKFLTDDVFSPFSGRIKIFGDISQQVLTYEYMHASVFL